MKNKNILINDIDLNKSLMDKIKLVHDNIIKIENYMNNDDNIIPVEDRNRLDNEMRNQINNFIVLTDELDEIEINKISKEDYIIDEFTSEKFIELENIERDIANRENEIRNNGSNVEEFYLKYVNSINKFIKHIYNEIVELIINYSDFVKNPDNPNNPFYEDKKEGISVEELKKELEGDNNCNCECSCNKEECNCSSVKETIKDNEIDISNTIVDPLSFVEILENNCKLIMKLINEMNEEYKKDEYNDFIKACIKESLINRVKDYNHNVTIIRAIKSRENINSTSEVAE